MVHTYRKANIASECRQLSSYGLLGTLTLFIRFVGKYVYYDDRSGPIGTFFSTNESSFRIWEFSLPSLFFRSPRVNIHNIYMFLFLTILNEILFSSFSSFFLYRPGELSISSISLPYFLVTFFSFHPFVFHRGMWIACLFSFVSLFSALVAAVNDLFCSLLFFYFSIFKKFSAAVHTPLNLSYLFAYTSKYLRT